MKHLLIGAAAVAALAISGPVWAQPAPSPASPGATAPAPAPTSSLPSEMNRMPAAGRPTSERGTGPVPGATAPSGMNMPPGMTMPATTTGPVQSINRMPAGGRATSERGTTGSVTRAHHRRHAVQSAKNSSADSQADQLNRQELSQLQSANPTMMNRMSAGGKATSGGPHQ